MTEKILNIMLACLFIIFCVVFAVKTVLIEVVKEERDKEWEQNQANTSQNNNNYIITTDSRFN